MSDLMTRDEVAEHLGINPDSVRSTLRRYGITEQRGYPRDQVLAMRRRPRGRPPTNPTPTSTGEAMTDEHVYPGDAQPGLDSLPADEAADRLAELLAIIADDGRTIRLTIDGEPVAALIPPDAADFLDRVEDEHCARVAQEALDESAGETVPWEQVKRELFLDEAGDGGR